MPNEKPNSILVRCITANATLVAVALAAAAVTLTAFPAKEQAGPETNPTADAQAAYLALMDQIGESETKLDNGTSDAPDMPGPTHPSEQAARLNRDLFAPLSAAAVRTRYKGHSRGRGPSLPRLAGTFIDGLSRHAMIAGSVVTVGDTVAGYKVIEIAPKRVVLQRGTFKATLVLGGKP